eukprot:gene5810-6097_t
MENRDRRLIRSIFKKVHPDLLTNHPFEKQCNSDSLKGLNVYLEHLSSGRMPEPVRLDFYSSDGTPELKRVQAQLLSGGALEPLFYAFGLISEDELAAAGGNGISVGDTDFLRWLQGQVAEAVRTAEQHEMLKWHVRSARTEMEEKYRLISVQVGAEYAASLAELGQQIEALQVLDQALAWLTTNNGMDFSELALQLYHPETSPVESVGSYNDEGVYNLSATPMRARITDDGVVHIVAHPEGIRDQLESLDLERARVLNRVASTWQRRVRELGPAVSQLLGVPNVWCDTKSEMNSQKFVLWAGYLLERRDEVFAKLGSRQFQFSIIVHMEPTGPLLAFQNPSPILNVRFDCPPNSLVDFLVSEAGESASTAAADTYDMRAKEEAVLERVRQALGAKCIIKICMSNGVLEAAQRLLDNADSIRAAGALGAKCIIKICMSDGVLEAAQRLLDNADSIRAAGVDLRGACIALDDCYEVWDSGFISIPYNFKVGELPSMVKMLQSGQSPVDAQAAQAAQAAQTAQQGEASSSDTYGAGGHDNNGAGGYDNNGPGGHDISGGGGHHYSSNVAVSALSTRRFTSHISLFRPVAPLLSPRPPLGPRIGRGGALRHQAMARVKSMGGSGSIRF